MQDFTRTLAAWTTCAVLLVACNKVEARPTRHFDSETTVRRLRDRVLNCRPYKRKLIEIDESEWRRVIGALRLASMKKRYGSCSLSSLMHGLRLVGNEMRFDDDSRTRVLDAVLSTTHGAAHFRHAAVQATRYGARFRWPTRTLSAPTLMRESHVDQTLACLGEYGIPANTPISIHGQEFEVFDVLRDCVMNFEMSGDELDWTAIALIHYLPPMRSWVTRFGQRHDFDELAESLLDPRAFASSSCSGSHRFHALVYLWRAHSEHRVLSASVADRVHARVKKLVACAVEAQLGDGSWGRLWREDRSRREQAERQGGRQLVLTGHLGEVLLCLPPDMRVPDSVLKHAGTWLWDALRNADAQALGRRLCPWTHAACVVKQLK